ncbi:hypothetical protein PRIPAC_81467 [Pristionchus pacificus]|uniref:SHSP domain-containing protein n=1 Tax=Pristionchus pacificus TaxID=54126 RepID=A0A2A6CNX4_PRIPA|nr:hypothetical protein PRIPAC_81467 [Pristionchus pacificus]|eukprot:PDM79798.1 hypothetical protein PRIPAC_32377 [Pristionchus pacificus]
MSLIGNNPVDCSMCSFEHILDDDFIARSSFVPYWTHYRSENAFNLGEALGDMENTNEKFAVTVDVSHFKPEEIKVKLNGNELMIEGDYEEKTDKHGTIKRSFVRKCTLPEDTNVECLRSSLNDKGHLTIEAPKKTEDLTQPNAIPITRG